MTAPPSPDPGEVERVARAIWEADGELSPWESNPDLHGYARRLARAALAAARPARESCPTCIREGGPYPCCPHCEDDGIHDVSKNGHDLPCRTCVTDSFRPATDAEQKVARVQALAEELERDAERAYQRSCGGYRDEVSDSQYRAYEDAAERIRVALSGAHTEPKEQR